MEDYGEGVDVVAPEEGGDGAVGEVQVGGVAECNLDAV